MTGLRDRIHNESSELLGVFWFELVVFFKQESNFLDIILLNIGAKKCFLTVLLLPLWKVAKGMVLSKVKQ